MIDVIGVPDPAWLSCFPEADVDQILWYVAQSWHELVDLFPLVHHAGEREPVLTKSLADFLDDPERRRAAAVGGRFHAERAVNIRKAGKTKQAGRTDIEYHYPAPGSAALTLEFKKLKGTNNCRSSYRNQGMAKFLSGTYAMNERVGVMCGLAIPELASEVDAMRASIRRCKSKLGCVPFLNGSILSESVPLSVGGITFQSNHAKLSTAESIRLNHLFLLLKAKPSP